METKIMQPIQHHQNTKHAPDAIKRRQKSEDTKKNDRMTSAHKEDFKSLKNTVIYYQRDPNAYQGFLSAAYKRWQT